MPKRPSTFKALSWRFEFFGYRLMEVVLGALPLPLIDRLGSGIGFVFYYLSPKYRHLAIRNLRLAFGTEKDLPEIHSLARATCQRTIANFLGTMKTTLLPTDKIEPHVSFQGLDELYQALSQGKGAFLVLGHMGNWEILNRLHQFLPPGTAAGGIYQPLKNRLVNAHLLRLRQQDGSRFFSKKGGFHAPAGFVKNGGLLIVVADQKVGRAGSTIPFFGRLSSLSPLPALLARKTKAPVLAAGIESDGPGRWKVVFQPLPPSPSPEEIIASLEKLIRRSPADYLWLHDRWRLDGRCPLSVTRKEPKISAATAPMRVLILCEQVPDPAALTPFFSQQRSNDLPLACEYLLITPQPIPSLPLKVQQAIAPTARELASRIHTLDFAQARPLELVVLDPPSPVTKEALALLPLPRVLENTQGLPLSEFFATLTAPHSTRSHAPSHS